MKFFASWTTRDPVYHSYDSNACILVSPNGVPKSWNITKWSTLPKELFIDSGAFSTTSILPSVEDVLHRQRSIVAGWPSHKKLFFAHPDLLLPYSLSFKQTTSIINKSLQRAKSYLKLFNKCEVPANPVGVIHGFDEESLLGSYYELKEIGYQHFALGSLALRFSTNRAMCLHAIEVMSLYNIQPLHIFGISLPMFDEFTDQNFQINSFDSASSAKLGFYGSVLYGSPPKRYVIAPTAKQKMRDTFFRFRTGIDKPQQCDCPVCTDNPDRLVPYHGTKAKQDRALHNYFQLKWATETLN